MSDLRTQFTDALQALEGARLAYEWELAGEIEWRDKLQADNEYLRGQIEATVQKWQTRANELSAQIAALEKQLFRLTHPADVYLTVGSEPYATSRFVSGMQDVDSGLRTGSQIARDRVGAVNAVLVSHVSNFGISQTWPTESIGKPTNWTSLDMRLQMFMAMGAEPVIIDHGWPKWMKELVDSSGARPYTDADPATGGRPRWDKEAQFRVYHYEIAKHTMKPPFNVRTRLFSNELKGFVMRKDGKRGFDHEEHTRWYNIWVEEIERAARDLGIDPATLKLGGNYAPIRTEGVANNDTLAAAHMLSGKPYGEYRSAPVRALEYFVANATRFDFICWDGGTGNPEGGEKLDAFTVAATKWQDMMAWANTLTDKPKLVTEAYTKTADDNNADPVRLCAAKLVSYLSIVEAGYSGAWPWGAIGQGEDSVNAGLLTGYAADSLTQPWYDAYACLGQHFSVGAQLYPVTVEGEGVYAKCADGVLVAVNMTPAAKSVCVDEAIYTVEPFGWLKVTR